MLRKEYAVIGKKTGHHVGFLNLKEIAPAFAKNLIVCVVLSVRVFARSMEFAEGNLMVGWFLVVLSSWD